MSRPQFAINNPQSAINNLQEHAWFDQLTMSAHPEPVEGCGLGDLCG